MIRYGVAIYGLNPSGDAIPTTPFPLEPALSLESELTYCKQVHAGDGISYGVTYRDCPDWLCRRLAAAPTGLSCPC